MPRIHWLFWLLTFVVLTGFSALIGGCTKGRTVMVTATSAGGVTTFTTVANAKPGDSVAKATASGPTLNLIRTGTTVEIAGFGGADAALNGTFTATGPAPGTGFSAGAPAGVFTVAQAGAPAATTTGTVTVPRPLAGRILEAMLLGLVGGALSWGFVWGLLALGGYRPWVGFVVCACFLLSPLWIILEILWWLAAEWKGRDWSFNRTPLAVVLLALFTGWFSGTMDGAWQVRSWSAFWQVPVEHTWALSGTSIATSLKLLFLNPPDEHVKAEYSAAMSVEGRNGFHQYVVGFAITKSAVFTEGHTMSDQVGIGLSKSTDGSGAQNPLATHEQQHILQNRLFGPLFPTLYLGWMGTTLVPSVFAGLGGGDAVAGINAWTYADNPFEVWGYTTGGNPTGIVDPAKSPGAGKPAVPAHLPLDDKLLWASPAVFNAPAGTVTKASWTTGPEMFLILMLLFGLTALALWARNAWGTTQARWWTALGEGGGCALVRYLLLSLNLLLNLGLTVATAIVSPGWGIVAGMGTVLALLAWLPPAARSPVGQCMIGFANLLAPASLFATLIGLVAVIVALVAIPFAWVASTLNRLRPGDGRATYDPQGQVAGVTYLPSGAEMVPANPRSWFALSCISGLSGGIAPLRLVVVGSFFAQLGAGGVALGPITFVKPERRSAEGEIPVGDERFLAGLVLGNAAFGVWQFLRFFDRPQPRPSETFWDLLAESAVPEMARSTSAFAQEPDRPRLPQWGDASGAAFTDHALVGGVLFCIAWLGLILAFAHWGWPGAPDVCVPDKDCYCEKHPDLVGTVPPGSAWTGTGYGPSGVKQPSNTWSDLSYLAVGLIVLWQAGRDRRRGAADEEAPNPMRRFSFYSICYGFVALYLGIGSMLFHASLTGWGGWADSFSLYVWASWLIAYDCARLSRLWEKGWEWIVFLSVFGTLAIVTGIVRAYEPKASLVLFAVPVGIMTVTSVYLINIGQMSGLAREARANSGWVASWSSWLWSGVGVFLGSLAVWKLSADGGPLCRPDSMIQGHAVFHIGGAFAAYAIWLNLRSETATPTTPRLAFRPLLQAFFHNLSVGLAETVLHLPQVIVFGLIPFLTYLFLWWVSG